MGSKYIKPPPLERMDSQGRIHYVGSGDGPKSAAEKRALLCPQAQSIISKFGGPRELARTLKAVCEDKKDHLTPSTIYRWLYPKEVGGTGGEIPLPSLQLILKVARRAGVILSSEDIYPHLVNRPEMPDQPD